MAHQNNTNTNSNSNSASPIIQIQNVHKQYRTLRGTVHALRGVSLNVHPGEVVVIVGPSGSGKSTLLRCINRLETTDGGRIIVDNIPLTSAKNINKVRAEVGMVFQSFNLFPDKTALENITLAQRIVRKRRKAEAEARAYDLLAKVGIPDKADAYPGQLSGGQQQRVAIARALAMDPKIMLFDEPTSALDSVIGDQVVKLIREELKARNTAAIIVTHDDRITHYADRTVRIEDGRISA